MDNDLKELRDEIRALREEISQLRENYSANFDTLAELVKILAVNQMSANIAQELSAEKNSDTKTGNAETPDTKINNTKIPVFGNNVNGKPKLIAVLNQRNLPVKLVECYGTEPPYDSDLAIYLGISDSGYDYTFFPKVCREYKKILLVINNLYGTSVWFKKFYNGVDWDKIDFFFERIDSKRAADLIEEYLQKNLSVNGAVICISKNEYEVKRDK